MDRTFVNRCIPYRFTPTGEGKTMEVLMISSQKGQGLLFPKVSTCLPLLPLLPCISFDPVQFTGEHYFNML